MAFTIPNGPDVAQNIRQAMPFSDDFAAIIAAIAGDGILVGGGVSAQGVPDNTVAVAAGQARVGGYFPFFAAATVSGFAAHASLDRIDLVCVDYNGVLSRVAGTAASSPNPPAIPANNIKLAQVFVPGAAAAITNAMITDRRIVVPDTFDWADEFLSSNLSATAATSTGSIGEFGWTIAASGTLAAPASQVATGNQQGILRTSTGATSGNNTQLSLGNTIDPTKVARMRFTVAIPTLTTSAFKLGLGQSINDAAAGSLGTAGAFIEYVPATSLKWRYTTRQGSVSTTNADTGADVAAATFYQFDIVRLQNGNWQFAKNGALAFLHSTNQPTTQCQIGTLTHTLTTAARNLDHDFFGLNFAPMGNRWT